MKIVSVYPKDVYVTFEMSIKQAGMILDALELAEIKYDPKDNPKILEAVEYLKTDFFKTLNEVVDEVKGK